MKSKTKTKLKTAFVLVGIPREKQFLSTKKEKKKKRRNNQRIKKKSFVEQSRLKRPCFLMESFADDVIENYFAQKTLESFFSMTNQLLIKKAQRIKALFFNFCPKIFRKGP